jgi:hypothetical protein
MSARNKVGQHIWSPSRRFLGYSCRGYEYLEADNTRGGILVAWDQDWMSGELPVKRRYSMSMKMTIKLSNIFWITTVCGPTENSEKSQFLSELISCQLTGTTPWLCLGDFNLICLCLSDFNLICEAEDKNNNNNNGRQMRDFMRALEQVCCWK